MIREKLLRGLRKPLCCLMLVVSFGVLKANAATWFVATTGSDSFSCSQAQSATTPKRTIIAALACVGAAGTEAGAGDTVQVAAGSYSESIVDRIPSGSGPGMEFTLKCESVRTCTNTLATAYPADAQLGFNAATHWVIIRDFVFVGGGGSYLSSETPGNFHHISFINNEMKDMPNGMGLQGGYADDITFKGNIVHDIGSGSHCLGYCHGIYPGFHTNRWIIEDNQFYNIAAYGIHVHAQTPDPDKVPEGHIIRRNITGNNGTVGVNGAGIIVYGTGHSVYNNIAYKNTMYGIMVRGNDTRVYNNTIYGNAQGGLYSESGSLSCINNLIVGNGGLPIEGPCSSNSNNITSGSAASFFLNTAAGDYRLVDGSTAIDRGANLSSMISDDFAGRARPQGNGFDVGAYEHIAGGTFENTSPPAPPMNLRVIP